LESDALLTTIHPLLEKLLQKVCRKLQDDSGTGGFDLRGSSFTFVSPSLKRFHYLKTAARLIASSPQAWWMSYKVSDPLFQAEHDLIVQC
jgi:hypothetical protein